MHAKAVLVQLMIKYRDKTLDRLVVDSSNAEYTASIVIHGAIKIRLW